MEPNPNRPVRPRQWDSVKIMLCGILVVLLSMALDAAAFAVFGVFIFGVGVFQRSPDQN